LYLNNTRGDEEKIALIEIENVIATLDFSQIHENIVGIQYRSGDNNNNDNGIPSGLDGFDSPSNQISPLGGTLIAVVGASVVFVGAIFYMRQVRQSDDSKSATAAQRFADLMDESGCELSLQRHPKDPWMMHNQISSGYDDMIESRNNPRQQVIEMAMVGEDEIFMRENGIETSLPVRYGNSNSIRHSPISLDHKRHEESFFSPPEKSFPRSRTPNTVVM